MTPLSPSRLDLPSLTDADCRALVHDVLQRVADVPAELVDLVVARADGNAFYVEELIKMLIDDGVIDTSAEDVWRVDLGRLDRGAVPSTLTGVLQARLDALVAEERRTLAVRERRGQGLLGCGRRALARDAAATDAALDVARRRELVFRRDDTSFDNTGEYLFKHALRL